MKYPHKIYALALSVFALTACDLFEPPNPGRDVDLEMEQENGDCITITFTAIVPEETESVFFDFGDGTTFEGENPPPHAYCHRGAYEFRMSASGDGWGASVPKLLSIFGTAPPPMDVLLGMPTTGTELHAVNLMVVSFERRYQTLGRVVALTNDESGQRVAFDGELAVEYTPPPGGSNGQDPAPTRRALAADDDLIYGLDLENYVHTSIPPWFLDDVQVATPPAVFPTINMGQYDIDLPLRVAEFPALDAPLTLRLYRGTNGGASGIRYVVRRNDQVWAFDAPENADSVTLSVEQLAEIGPGLAEIWAVTTLRRVADDDESVTFGASFIEGKTVILAPGGGETADAGVSNDDAGTVTSADAGAIDAADAGVSNDDAGTVTPRDAGTIADGDAGTTIPDAGTSANDAGPSIDAGHAGDAG